MAHQQELDHRSHAAEASKLRDLRFQKFQALTIAHSELPNIEMQLQEAKMETASLQKALEESRAAHAKEVKSTTRLQKKCDSILAQREAVDLKLKETGQQLVEAQVRGVQKGVQGGVQGGYRGYGEYVLQSTWSSSISFY